MTVSTLPLWFGVGFIAKFNIFVLLSIWIMFTTTTLTTSKGKLIVSLENNSSSFTNNNSSSLSMMTF